MTLFRVALTGGPCAGKTTAVGRLASVFKQRGWLVYGVPEAATLLIGSMLVGGQMELLDEAGRFDFQRHLLRLILTLEQHVLDVAEETCKGGANVLLVCDRGALDPRAYMDESDWARLLAEEQLTGDELLARYDFVVHLTTAADGAEDFYSTDSVRTETAQLAREVDVKTLAAWAGHPRHRIIENRVCCFKQKLQLVEQAVMDAVLEQVVTGFGLPFNVGFGGASSSLVTAFDRAAYDQAALDSQRYCFADEAAVQMTLVVFGPLPPNSALMLLYDDERFTPLNLSYKGLNDVQTAVER